MICLRVCTYWETNQEEEKNVPYGRVSHRKESLGGLIKVLLTEVCYEGGLKDVPGTKDYTSGP